MVVQLQLATVNSGKTILDNHTSLFDFFKACVDLLRGIIMCGTHNSSLCNGELHGISDRGQFETRHLVSYLEVVFFEVNFN